MIVIAIISAIAAGALAARWRSAHMSRQHTSNKALDRLLETQRLPRWPAPELLSASETTALAHFDEALRNAWTQFFAEGIAEPTVMIEMGELMKELTSKLQLTKIKRQYEAGELEELIALLKYLNMLRAIHADDHRTDAPCELISRTIRLLTATRELRIAESRTHR